MKALFISIKIICGLSIILLSAPVLATTWQVPGDAPTIQAGIDLAASGDIVEVECGDYYENNISMKEGVTLLGALDRGGCVTLHGNGEAGIWFSDIGFCAVKGLSFVGFGESALRLVNASPLIEGCHFEGNTFTDGGAIHMLGSSPTILNCNFLGNSASHAGGAIAMGGCAGTIENCFFDGNSSNYGGAIDVESGSTPFISGCTMTNNVANHAGGALFVWVNNGPSYLIVSGSTILDNMAPVGADGWVDSGCSLTIIDSVLAPDFNDTFDGPGTIIVDYFVENERKTWGEVKSIYR